MNKTVQTVLTVFCALMILTLPFLVPSPKLLESAVDRILEEAPAEADEAGSLLDWLFTTAKAEEEGPAYSLPVDLTPGYEPNPACYTENGYEDDSITVQMETVEDDGVLYCIARVTVKSPTQLRTASAGSLKSRKYARISSMAAKNNAIVAINGDNFANDPQKTTYEYRMSQQIRAKTNRKKDILIIDENGDFHLFVKSDKEKLAAFEKSGLQIINAFTFGPALVIDGEVQSIDKSYGYNPGGKEPRMAIGQTGTLSYILVMAEGRNKNSEGVTQQEMADFMGELGCVQAFNLDGGNSAEMIFNNAFYGSRTGNERDQSDIIYFATAVDPAEWKGQ